MSEILNEGQEIDSLALTKMRWFHRRLHAYISLAGIFIITGLMMIDSPLVPVTRLEAISDPIGWVIITLGSIVLGYAGFNVLEAKMNKSASK